MIRSRRARYLGSAALAALAAAGVLAVAANQGPGAAAATSPKAAAWLNRPVAIPQAQAPRNPGLPGCSTAGLQVRLVRHGLLQGNAYGYIYQATNRSGHACYISGRPGVRVAGQALAKGANVLDLSAGSLKPGASATFAILQTPRTTCTAAAAYRAVRRAVTDRPSITIGARSGHAVRAGTLAASKCSRTTVTPVGVVPAAPKPGPLGRLSVSLQVPARVQAGHTLRFTVVLSNPARVPVRLSPCPAYETGISVAPAVAYRLNCSARVIPAGGSRAFGIRYAVPAGAPAGVAKIGWFLLNPARTGTGALVTITR